MTAQRQWRAALRWALFVTAQLVKIGAAGVAFYEFAGSMRPEGLAFAAFLLTVAQSLETTSNNMTTGGGKS